MYGEAQKRLKQMNNKAQNIEQQEKNNERFGSASDSNNVSKPRRNTLKEVDELKKDLEELKKALMSVKLPTPYDIYNSMLDKYKLDTCLTYEEIRKLKDIPKDDHKFLIRYKRSKSDFDLYNKMLKEHIENENIN